MAEQKIDISSLQPNSHKSKDDAEKKIKKKVIEGEVITKEKSLGSKFVESFFGGDLRTAASYILYDVAFPSIKRAISDMFADGIEMLLFGTARSGRSGRKEQTREKVSYSSYFKSDSRSGSVRSDASSRYDYRDIVLRSRGEAEEVLDVLREIISEYDQVTVADLYDAVGITGEFTDNKYGWTNLSGARVRLIRDGYLLDLPRAKELD